MGQQAVCICIYLPSELYLKNRYHSCHFQKERTSEGKRRRQTQRHILIWREGERETRYKETETERYALRCRDRVREGNAAQDKNLVQNVAMKEK